MVSQKSTQLLQRWVVQNIFHAVSLTSHTTSRDFLFFFFLSTQNVFKWWRLDVAMEIRGGRGWCKIERGVGVGTTCKKTVHRSRCEVTSSVFRMEEKVNSMRRRFPAWASGTILWSPNEWHAQEREWSDSFQFFVYFFCSKWSAIVSLQSPYRHRPS